MTKSISGALAALFVGFFLSFGAEAGTITAQTFDVDPILGNTQAPNVWYTDRFAPAGFSSVFFAGDNRLALELSASDNAAGRGAQNSNFYSTQGRKYDTPDATMLSIDMYIASSFQNIAYNSNLGTGRIGGLWGTGINAANDISFYPIIEFFDSQFQVWNSFTGWNAVGLPTGFIFDTFVNLEISLDAIGDIFNFYIAGDLLESFGANGTISFANAIIQGKNDEPGVNRTLYFDNFEAYNVSVVPLPAALPLYGTGLALMGFVGWRRRKAATA